MATDMSGQAAGALTASSMAATNTVSTSNSMTAPGSASESTRGEQAGDPALDESGHARTVLVHGEDGGQAASVAWENVSPGPR